jgi:ATP-binding cassette subfamily B protein
MSIYAIGSLILGLSGSFLGSAAALFSAMNTRQGMYSKVNTYSFYEVDKFSTASLITRMSNDVQRNQMCLQMILTFLFRSPVTIIVSIVNSFTPPMGNTTYGCIIIAIVIVMLTVVAAIGFKVLPIFTKAQNKLDATNKVMRENILGARVIKTFNIQNEQHARYEEQNKDLKKLNIRGQALLLPIMSVIMFILNASIVIILIVAGLQFRYSSSHPQINAGIFAFTQLIAIVLFNTLNAIMVIVMATRTEASAKRINAVLDTDPKIKDPINPKALNNNYTVKFKNVDFKYNDKAQVNTLEKIDFEIDSGKTLGIVGGTGSGKSTIANLIPRFYEVNSGAIEIGGTNIKDVTQTELCDKVCLVPQDALLFSGTIESNLKFGKKDANERDMQQACDDACAWDFVSKMKNKLQSHVEQRGRNFSGGQKQRLSLARTLIKHPKILILDDTTSALDLLTEAKVQENLQKNYKDCTKIIISQRISSVKNADKILVLDAGKIVDSGTHQQLVKTSMLYRDIVQSQLGKEGME